MRAGWNCFRFAKIIYVMPVLFAYSHILLTGSAWENTAAIIAATLGTMLFSTVSTAYLVVRTTLLEWVALAAATVLAYLVRPEAWAVALALFAGVFLLNRRRAGGAAAPARAQAAERPAPGG